jgi:hypothetical protein
VRHLIRILPLAGALLGSAALTAQAQEKATELTAGVLGLGSTTCNGCDGVFEIATGGASTGAFTGVGGGSLAVGLYLSPRVAIEPTLALNLLSSDGESLTILSLGVAVPYYLKQGWGRKGTYFAPRLVYNSISGGGESANQVALGIAVGTKVPLNDMAALRVQANFDYGFEGDYASTTSFGAFLGLSVFLK